MVLEILMDELKHVHKYDYILYLRLEKFRKQQGSWKTAFTIDEPMKIARIFGVDFRKDKSDLKESTMGLNTELKHGKRYYETNTVEDHPLIRGKICLSHLREFSDYYTMLMKFEEEAKEYWYHYRETTEFTLRQLAYYDGTMGKPSYVAVNGIIYDVSYSPAWSKGSHYGLTPGKDFSSLFDNWHGLTPSMLEKLPKVGILIP